MLGFATTYSYSWKRSQRRRFWASNCSGVLSKISGYCFHKHISKKCLGVSKNIRWFFRTRGKKCHLEKRSLASSSRRPLLLRTWKSAHVRLNLIWHLLWKCWEIMYETNNLFCTGTYNANILFGWLENKKLWSVRSQTQNCHQKTIVTRLFLQSHLTQCLYIY